MYKLMARTKRTDWQLVDEYETKEQARKAASDILNKDSSIEIMIEEDNATKTQT